MRQGYRNSQMLKYGFLRVGKQSIAVALASSKDLGRPGSLHAKDWLGCVGG